MPKLSFVQIGDRLLNVESIVMVVKVNGGVDIHTRDGKVVCVPDLSFEEFNKALTLFLANGGYEVKGVRF